jgi:drug/metabolite transporter (DMT)-like permease
MFDPRPQAPVTAVALILTATMFIAATTLFAKALGTGVVGDPLHPVQITHGRFVFAFLALGLAAAMIRPRLHRPHWPLHLARTTCGALGVTLMFAAVAYIPLAEATAITFLNPVFAMLLAIPLLGERVGRIRWSAAAMALAGAMILLRPTPGSFQAASLLALAAALVMGLELIFIKKLSGREAPFQILLVNNLIGVGISTLAVLPVWQVPTLAQWGLLAALGVFMALAQTFFVNAMARADASFVAPFSYMTLIFAALYDFAIFHVVPDPVAWIGAGVILAGGLLLALREGQLRTRAQRKVHKPRVQRL